MHAVCPYFHGKDRVVRDQEGHVPFPADFGQTSRDYIVLRLTIVAVNQTMA